MIGAALAVDGVAAPMNGAAAARVAGATPLLRAALASGTRRTEDARMTANPPAPAPADGPPGDAADAVPTAPASGHAAADTLADAADEKGAVEATRRMPEPDSLGG
jgi:hypothetical protein